MNEETKTMVFMVKALHCGIAVVVGCKSNFYLLWEWGYLYNKYPRVQNRAITITEKRVGYMDGSASMILCSGESKGKI